MLTVKSQGAEVALAGSIDENTMLVELLDRARDGRLVLDLGGVRFINSIGMREWVSMQREAVRRGLRIEMRRVPEAIVHQLNIVPAARGTSVVTSFYAPYVCDDCDREDDVLLEVAPHRAELAQRHTPARKCHVCGSAMVLADPPEIYFLFISGA